MKGVKKCKMKYINEIEKKGEEKGIKRLSLEFRLFC